MGESKHTPGPWKYGRYTQSIQAQDGERLVANLDMRAEEGDPSVHADGLLMAAAPQMLEVLREAEDHISECMAYTSGGPCDDVDGKRCGPCQARVAVRAAIRAATGDEP